MASHDALRRSLKFKLKLILSENKILVQTIEEYIKKAEAVYRDTESMEKIPAEVFKRAMGQMETAYSACIKLILLATDLFEERKEAIQQCPQECASPSKGANYLGGSDPANESDILQRLASLEEKFHKFVSMRTGEEYKMEASQQHVPVQGQELCQWMLANFDKPEIYCAADPVVELRRFLFGLDRQNHDRYKDPRIIFSNERKKYPTGLSAMSAQENVESPPNENSNDPLDDIKAESGAIDEERGSEGSDSITLTTDQGQQGDCAQGKHPGEKQDNYKVPGCGNHEESEIIGLGYDERDGVHQRRPVKKCYDAGGKGKGEVLSEEFVHKEQVKTHRALDGGKRTPRSPERQSPTRVLDLRARSHIDIRCAFEDNTASNSSNLVSETQMPRQYYKGSSQNGKGSQRIRSRSQIVRKPDKTTHRSSKWQNSRSPRNGQRHKNQLSVKENVSPHNRMDRPQTDAGKFCQISPENGSPRSSKTYCSNVNPNTALVSQERTPLEFLDYSTSPATEKALKRKNDADLITQKHEMITQFVRTESPKAQRTQKMAEDGAAIKAEYARPVHDSRAHRDQIERIFDRIKSMEQSIETAMLNERGLVCRCLEVFQKVLGGGISDKQLKEILYVAADSSLDNNTQKSWHDDETKTVRLNSQENKHEVFNSANSKTFSAFNKEFVCESSERFRHAKREQLRRSNSIPDLKKTKTWLEAGSLEVYPSKYDQSDDKEEDEYSHVQRDNLDNLNGICPPQSSPVGFSRQNHLSAAIIEQETLMNVVPRKLINLLSNAGIGSQSEEEESPKVTSSGQHDQLQKQKKHCMPYLDRSKICEEVQNIKDIAPANKKTPLLKSFIFGTASDPSIPALSPVSQKTDEILRECAADQERYLPRQSSVKAPSFQSAQSLNAPGLPGRADPSEKTSGHISRRESLAQDSIRPNSKGCTKTENEDSRSCQNYSRYLQQDHLPQIENTAKQIMISPGRLDRTNHVIWQEGAEKNVEHQTNNLKGAADALENSFHEKCHAPYYGKDDQMDEYSSVVFSKSRSISPKNLMGHLYAPEQFQWNPDHRKQQSSERSVSYQSRHHSEPHSEAIKQSKEKLSAREETGFEPCFKPQTSCHDQLQPQLHDQQICQHPQNDQLNTYLDQNDYKDSPLHESSPSLPHAQTTKYGLSDKNFVHFLQVQGQQSLGPQTNLNSFAASPNLGGSKLTRPNSSFTSSPPKGHHLEYSLPMSCIKLSPFVRLQPRTSPCPYSALSVPLQDCDYRSTSPLEAKVKSRSRPNSASIPKLQPIESPHRRSSFTNANAALAIETLGDESKRKDQQERPDTGLQVDLSTDYRHVSNEVNKKYKTGIQVAHWLGRRSLSSSGISCAGSKAWWGPLPENTRTESRTVCIRNLPSKLEEMKLLRLLNQHGYVSKIYFIKHRSTGDFQGTAYVKYQHQKEAESAMLALNLLTLDECKISASLVSTKQGQRLVK